MFVSQIFDEASEILGTTDQSKVFRKLTQAVQALMESGHWFHTQAEVDVCTGWDGCTITLPRGIEVPLAVNIDGSPLYFRGRLFQYNVNKGGMYNTVGWCWDDRGFVATQMDIRQPAQVIAVAESDADVGKTLRLVGTDNNNRELRTQLPDGTGVDGLLVQVHSQSDFQLGTIVPDGNTIVTRDVAITPFNEFSSSSAHKLSSGQAMILSSATGTVPTGLTVSDQYYVGVVNPTTIQLYNDPLYAQSGEYPINLISIAGAGTLTLTDQRNASLVTAVQLSSAPTITLNSGNEVVFSGSPLPSPLVSGVTYFANVLDSTHLQIFSTVADAQSQTNPIYLTGSTSTFNIQLRKTIAPITEIKFNLPHLFATGDVVQAYTNGGTLPQPLVEAQNYYVQVIDSLTIVLHTSAADATSGNNPIILTTSGSGQNTLNKLIPATAQTGKTSQITAPGFSLPTATGSGATINAVVSGPVISLTISNVGSGYTSAPSVTITGGGGYGATAHAIVGTVSGTSQYQTVIAVVLDQPGQGYTSNPTVVFSGGGGSNAAATASITTSFVTQYNIVNGGSGYTVPPSISFPTVSPGQTVPVATTGISDGAVNQITVSNGGTGYTTAPTISFTNGGGGTGASATASVSGGVVTAIYITNGGSGYTSAPTVNFAGGGGANAAAYCTIANGVVSSVTIVSEGTGYNVAPVVTVTPSTGILVSFSTTGTLPAPLQDGVTYRAEAPSGTNSFTLVNDDYSPINLTSVGSGQLYLTISRTFYIGFTNVWAGDFLGVSSGTGIYFGTDYLLPITSPTIDNGITEFYIKPLTNTTAQIYSDAGLTTLVTISQLGTGQSYYAIQESATAVSYNNLVSLSSLQYLQNGETVQFTTTGTLPAPLTASTNYTIQINGSYVQVYDSTGTTLQAFTSLGVGQLSLEVIRQFTPVAPNTITLTNAFFSTGTAVVPRPVTGDILDPNLTAGTTYYVRLLDPQTIQLFDTLAHANNIVNHVPNNTGLITFTTVGNTSASTFILDAVEDPTFVKAVYHVDKPVTQGYVSLYAYDYGRSNDMALIGQYHPSETNPMYRRIRVGQKCAWARIIYRVKHPTITSIYDYIPVEQERAILAAVHAIDLEDKDFSDQAMKYWQLAFGYLRNQQTSMDGHAIEPIQVNNLVYGDKSDPVIESGWGAYDYYDTY